MGKFIKRLQDSGHEGWLAQAPPVSRASDASSRCSFGATSSRPTPPTSLASGVRSAAGYPCLCGAGPRLSGPAMGPTDFTYPSPRRVRAASFVDVNFTRFGLAAELYSMGVANAAFLIGVRCAVP